MNLLQPNHMTAAERLDELFSILSKGLVRLRMRERQLSAEMGEFPLHKTRGQSGHAKAKRRRPA